MSNLQFLLLPFALIYGLIIFIRNKFYDWGIFKSTSFSVPVISIGNIHLGGTGKTPLVFYISKLLSDEFKPAVLSRGYGRKSAGYIEVNSDDSSGQTGDEPLMLKRKKPGLIVSVCEKRTEGIQSLMQRKPAPDVIILDDAFQHRAVKPGLSVLLISMKKLLETEFLFPAGNLREWPSARERADIIVITRCPAKFSPLEQRRITENFPLAAHQQLFFSYTAYTGLIPAFSQKKHIPVDMEYYFQKKYSVLLFTGIADSSGLLQYIEEHFGETTHLKFPDHYNYRKRNIKRISTAFKNIINPNKIIITTEKDIARIEKPEHIRVLEALPVFYLQVESGFNHAQTQDQSHPEDEHPFDKTIRNYVRRNKVNS